MSKELTLSYKETYYDSRITNEIFHILDNSGLQYQGYKDPWSPGDNDYDSWHITFNTIEDKILAKLILQNFKDNLLGKWATPN